MAEIVSRIGPPGKPGPVQPRTRPTPRPPASGIAAGGVQSRRLLARARGVRLFAPVLAVAHAVPVHADSLAAIQQRGSLRVLVVEMSGPDVFFPVKAPGGFDREILDGFAALHRLRVEVVPVASWDALVPSLQAGGGDLIAGRVTVTERRRQLISFTSGVFPTRAVVVTRKPHPVVSTRAQLRSERVGTVRGTSLAEAVAAADVPSANVDDSIGLDSGVLPLVSLPAALREGRITVAVMGVESAIIAQQQDPQLQLGLFLGPPGTMAYGVRKQDTELLSALNEYIDNLRRTPTWNRLVIKYFGEAALEVLNAARSE